MNKQQASTTASPIFVDLTLDERQALLRLLKHERFKAGESILSEGLSTHALWIIVQGRCEVIQKRHNATEKQLAVLEAGAVFGEMSFFAPAPHSASVRAITDVEVMRLSREDFDDLGRNGSVVALKIAASTARLLAERLRRMDEWTRNLIEQPDVNNHKEEWQEFRAKLYSDWQF